MDGGGSWGRSWGLSSSWGRSGSWRCSGCWRRSWSAGDSERQLLVYVLAVAGDLTAEIKSPRARGFVCVFIHACGRQLFCLREVTSIVRFFVWQQPDVVHATALEYDVSTRRHSLCPLCGCHSKLPINVLPSYWRMWVGLHSSLVERMRMLVSYAFSISHDITTRL